MIAPARWNLQLAIKDGHLHVIAPQSVLVSDKLFYAKETHKGLQALLDRFAHMRPLAARPAEPAHAAPKQHAWRPSAQDVERYQQAHRDRW
ncbi:hypothetical protein [Cupriavidus necator]